MASTEAGVSSAIVSAVQAIAVSTLGFDDANGNVRDYLLEHVADEKQSSYLIANVSSAKKVRCWACFVTANDVPFAVGNITERFYNIQIVGYYEIGQNGDGAKTLASHSRSVRNAIRGIGISLSGTVDRIVSVSDFTIDKISGVDPSKGEILVGKYNIQAAKRNPDF